MEFHRTRLIPTQHHLFSPTVLLLVLHLYLMLRQIFGCLMIGILPTPSSPKSLESQIAPATIKFPRFGHSLLPKCWVLFVMYSTFLWTQIIVIRKHLRNRRSINVDWHDLLSMRQSQGEKITLFVARLKRQSRVLGATPAKELNGTIELLQALESADIDSSAMHEKNIVAALGPSKPKQPIKIKHHGNKKSFTPAKHQPKLHGMSDQFPCSNCGTLHGSNICPSSSRECTYCHNKGHFANFCRKRDPLLTDMRTSATNDPDYQFLLEAVINGTPINPYKNIWSSLTINDGLLHHGHKARVPTSLRPEILRRLYEVGGNQFLAVVDRSTGYPFVYHWSHAPTSSQVSMALLKIFSSFGAPLIIRWHNGPQFSTSNFRDFLGKCNIDWRPSSPYNPKSNGLVERIVRTLKDTMSRLGAQNLNSQVLEALLLLRNTPRLDGASPAFRMFRRIFRTQIPTLDLNRPCDIEQANVKRSATRTRQNSHHDKHTRPLSELLQGTHVRIQHPISKRWQPGGTILNRHGGGHFYAILLNGKTIHRNRRFLKSISTPITTLPATHGSSLSSSNGLFTFAFQ
ncbi:hypothetical protein TCAL_12810 [Tigriopus californicus]|uniref:Integrase catalytic domain-containing protein n=1 Tax=Tigriopus californicus TaxID=6832 RepID=A0A553PPZ3_TIGCA|nr:hypothetical protein TCAL_12810 [Tigriopus californicus]